MFCPTCGNRVRERDSYCGSCGTHLTEIRRHLASVTDTVAKSVPIERLPTDATTVSVPGVTTLPGESQAGFDSQSPGEADASSGGAVATRLTRSGYIGLTGLLLSLIFAIMAVEVLVVNAIGIYMINGAVLVGMIAILVASYFMLRTARSSGDKVGLGISGYLLVTLDFGYFLAGLTTGGALGVIELVLISAFAVCVVVAIAGYSRPTVFDTMGGIFGTIFATCLVACVICLFTSGGSVAVDWLVLALCSSTLAFDVCRAVDDEPTVGNALFHAASIYVDIFLMVAMLLVLLCDGDRSRRGIRRRRL